ncbi:WD40 repeat-like domain-containing protein [Beauveria bassiana ARSEF 2860]|uniref:WD40 repeat-like domain-containing protein n=1 Tax=Beauveria bassiana (strain ARSEF 2860) TaxID=655819 RepID=J4KL08_BEAB2|nr:WD40 repeat-like domain-containing protein [Beauveria bassiana ARSEF 2860]EJP61379.1 WD40 repeat-like domain-containing protein [Beauveria bassiana ARSEF 2860]
MVSDAGMRRWQVHRAALVLWHTELNENRVGHGILQTSVYNLPATDKGSGRTPRKFSKQPQLPGHSAHWRDVPPSSRHMEALGVASGVIAVVELSAKVLSLCLQYSKEVKNAANNISQLRSHVSDLKLASASLHQLLNGPNASRFSTSQQLQDAIGDSVLQLRRLHEKLRPKTARQALSRFGLRSLRWPLQSKELERIMQNLRQHTQTISFALQIDITTILLTVDQTMVLNQLRVAEGASFDSYAQEHNRICLADTRIELLQQITDWAKDKNAEPIFWLNGMAGTGKSTISRTIARSFSENGQLGASFFFKKVLQPLLKTANENTPIAIIVDALDECERDEDIKLIIRLFSRFKTEEPWRVRAFFTSRPELPIRCGFRKSTSAYREVILHEMPQIMVERDISLFLKHELARIRDDYHDSVPAEQHLDPDWPGQSNVDALARMAFPLFIVATTICLFISERKIATPNKQLEKVLSQSRGGVSQLEQTYRSVLDTLVEGVSPRVRDEIVLEFRKVVGSIVLLARPLSTSTLAKILDVPRDDVDSRLALLHSVLSIPHSAEAPVRLLHLSFRDFLLDPDEPTMPFRVFEKQTHEDLATECLRILRCLKQDLCHIGAPGTPRSAISTEKVNDNLAPELQYACSHWIYHLQQAGTELSDGMEAHYFLARHFLHWIEALALLGKVIDSLGLIKTLQSQLKPQKSTELSQLLDDASRFLCTYVYAIDSTPLQLYSSLLLFAPKSSKVDDQWNKCIRTLEGHTASVLSVVFSHNSTLLATASSDKSVRVWRSDTGECVKTLEGHGDSVTSVAFSHDSKLLASASGDKTSRVWRSDTGECVKTLEGHGDSVESVCFSHDSTLLATASSDKSVRIWRSDTGECVNTLEGHNDPVTSVAYSHDSKLLASASGDKTSRVWRSDTGECIRIFHGHSGWVRSVVFSHDSAQVVSASSDKSAFLGHSFLVSSAAFSQNSTLVASASSDTTVRLWDGGLGGCIENSDGHSECVLSVVFSNDSTLVASTSVDMTVRIWRVDTGECMRILRGHSHWVLSVAFSHDSVLVASASCDKTLRIWRIDTGECTHILKGHGDDVRSVTFSHDSSLLASASYDKTARIWRRDRGECVKILKGHGDSVESQRRPPINRYGSGTVTQENAVARFKVILALSGL